MNKIVIGCGCGDEGKGLFTDYLCSHSENSLVVRFSGGHQAGHTVFTDKTNHIFSNFGSGTLRGRPTYWSKYCTVEPIGLLKELKLLLSKDINPLLYIDAKCPITTPYDIYMNRKLDKENLHGTVGVGFGTTIEREEKHHSLTFNDLFYPDILISKLERIEEYYDLNNSYNNDYIEINEFLKSCKVIINHDCIQKIYEIPSSTNYIFEGSQGLLLDQNFGFFPNVTRSNTGCKNIVELLGNDNFETYLVTRAYQTRHGNGFMTNEDIPHNILDNPLETNKQHKYQGEFRRSLLDVSLLEYAINKDDYIRESKNKNLVITCLDHIVNEYRFTYKGEIIYSNSTREFVNKIIDILKIYDVYISESNNSKNIIRWC
uniref:Putative adenylosuccinate synthase n=1 Tax=viral metagenome TaxID=1070528 RepID=A0A6M3JW66_9ZZZZ